MEQEWNVVDDLRFQNTVHYSAFQDLENRGEIWVARGHAILFFLSRGVQIGARELLN